MKKNRDVKPRPRCPVQKKAQYDSQDAASRAMMRVWSHDTSMNIMDMHTYLCDQCGAWHFGHISYYQAAQAAQQSASV